MTIIDIRFFCWISDLARWRSCQLSIGTCLLETRLSEYRILPDPDAHKQSRSSFLFAHHSCPIPSRPKPIHHLIMRCLNVYEDPAPGNQDKRRTHSRSTSIASTSSMESQSEKSGGGVYGGALSLLRSTGIYDVVSWVHLMRNDEGMCTPPWYVLAYFCARGSLLIL